MADLRKKADATILLTGGSTRLRIGDGGRELVKIVQKLAEAGFPKWKFTTVSPRDPKACTSRGVAELAVRGPMDASFGDVLPFHLTTETGVRREAVLVPAGTIVSGPIPVSSPPGGPIEFQDIFARFGASERYLLLRLGAPVQTPCRVDIDLRTGEIAVVP